MQTCDGTVRDKGGEGPVEVEDPKAPDTDAALHYATLWERVRSASSKILPPHR